MRKDYHLHPCVIQKRESFALFVNKALEEGIEEICITDHMPLQRSHAKDRIPHGKVKEYCEQVRELAEIYKADLSIKLGIEIDFHPSVQSEIEQVLSQGDFDFVLGSSHLHVLCPELFDQPVSRNEYAAIMFRNTIEAVKSGYFDAVAHVDMHRWVFSRPDRFPLLDDGYDEGRHTELIEELLDTMKTHQVYLELNPHFASHTHAIDQLYPSEGIVQRALRKGVQFSYGSDAHTPECVGEYLTAIREHPVYGQALTMFEKSL